MRVLVTGATGALGSALLPALRETGHEVRGLSRRPPMSDGTVEWVRGDLSTGEGLAEAVRDVDVIVHAATDQAFTPGKAPKLRKVFLRTGKPDAALTRRLLFAAATARTSHVIFCSIVGIDRVAMSYYKDKLAAEEVVRTSGLPLTIVRMTQFHYLIDAMLRFTARFPIASLPLRSRYQPIDERDAARLVASLVGEEPRYGIVEFGGPEVHRLDEMIETWRAARGVKKKFRSVPMPGAKAMAEGALLTKERSGTITWERWLKEAE